MQGEINDLDQEFEDELEGENLDELSPKGEELRAEFDAKIETIEKQIKILKWVLEEE